MRYIFTFWTLIQTLGTLYESLQNIMLGFHVQYSLQISDVGYLESECQFLHELVPKGWQIKSEEAIYSTSRS